MSRGDSLDDKLTDPNPSLEEAVEALLMTAGVMSFSRRMSVLTMIDRRRLLWLHRALLNSRGEPMPDYSQYRESSP